MVRSMSETQPATVQCPYCKAAFTRGSGETLNGTEYCCYHCALSAERPPLVQTGIVCADQTMLGYKQKRDRHLWQRNRALAKQGYFGD